jgi:hypothetical protein
LSSPSAPFPSQPNKTPFDFDDFVERIIRYAFKVAGAIVILSWLYHHVAQELGL